MRHHLQVNGSLGYPQQADIVSYPIPTEHSHILRYTIRNEEVKYFTKPMNHWPLAGTMTSTKPTRDPSFRKYLQFCLRIKVPPTQSPTIYTQLRRGCEVLFHLPDEFSSSVFQVTRTGEQSFNAHEEFCGCHPAGAFHPSLPNSFLSTALYILTQLFSAVHPFRIFLYL